MRPITVPALAVLALAALAGCGPRSHVYTYVKPKVAEAAFNQDVETLKGVSGVTQVIPRLDGQGNASIELYVKEDEQLPGQKKAVDLGYQRVRN